ncbi:MAG TPA: NAD(P)-dependent oxidoreductase [Candidatus Dormibacteraeota bacterium]
MKVLILAPFDAAELERLRAVAEVVHESWVDERRMHSPDELAGRVVAGGFDAVVVEAEFVTRDVLEATPGLRVVASARGKPVNVDLAAATELGRVILGTPGRNADSVADLCMGMLLDRVRHISAAARLVREGGWVVGLDDDSLVPYIRFRGVELAGRRLGLLGFGAVARALAGRARAFGMEVQAHDPFVDAAVMEAHGVVPVELDALLATSEVLSVHVERTSQTVGMLSAERLRALPRGAILINTARAQVVDQDAIVALVAEGHLAAAALDVVAPEPLPAGHPLLGDDRLLVLPHIGGATVGVVRRHSEMIREDLELLIRGERPLRCANPEVLDAVLRPR